MVDLEGALYIDLEQVSFVRRRTAGPADVEKTRFSVAAPVGIVVGKSVKSEVKVSLEGFNMAVQLGGGCRTAESLGTERHTIFTDIAALLGDGCRTAESVGTAAAERWRQAREATSVGLRRFTGGPLGVPSHRCHPPFCAALF